MRTSKRTSTVAFIATALFAIAGVATAEVGVDDTLIEYGHDEVNQTFIIGVAPSDSPWDCDLAESGELTVAYGEAEDGTIPVDDLTDGTDTVEFPNRDPEDVGDEYEPADSPTPYTGSDGECGLLAAPFGRVVNHGQFMKLTNQLLDMKGRGCLNRIIARSDLGKEPLHLADDFERSDEGTLEFSSATADCERGKRDKGEDHPSNANRGTEKDRSTRGNSANAPGHQG
jgi:hypothetical protein